MIPSVDTYVYQELETKLKAILRHEDILRQALAGLDERARENFIKTYSGDKPKKPIEVSYQYPGTKESFDARYVVQLGSSHETANSLGNIQSNFDFREGDTIFEYATIEEGSTHLYLKLTQPIGELTTVENISFARSDNVKLVGNKITFRKPGNEHLVGSVVGVHYLSKLNNDGKEDPVGVKKGYTSNDEVEITPISVNMDTARCMDALLKVIMIVMLDNIEENTGFLLKKMTFQPMQNIISDADRLVFGRPLTIEYVVTNTVDYDFTHKITEVILRGFGGIE